MEEVRSTARLADPAGFDFEARGITATIPRTEVEEALHSDMSPELFLDVARPGDDEFHTVMVSWDRGDLERILEASSGDAVKLTFDREELAYAIGDDVEAHGLREKAAVLTVIAGIAGAAAGTAAAQYPGGPDWSTGPAITATADRGGDFVTDVSSAAPGDVIASDRGVVPVTDVGGQAVAVDRGSDFVTDVSSAAPGDMIVSDRGVVPVTDTSSTPLDPAIVAAMDEQAAVSDRGDFVTDTSSTAQPGTEAQPGFADLNDQAHFGSPAVAGDARGTDFVTDASSSGPGTSTAPVGDEGGISIPAPAAGAAIAGGLALLIAGAGFAMSGDRRRGRPGTA
jgi:hypothetical protein